MNVRESYSNALERICLFPCSREPLLCILLLFNERPISWPSARLAWFTLEKFANAPAKCQQRDIFAHFPAAFVQKLFRHPIIPVTIHFPNTKVSIRYLLYRVVQQNLGQKIEVFSMLFHRYMKSLKQNKNYFHFRCWISPYYSARAQDGPQEMDRN